MPEITVMVEPKAPVRSDQDSSYEEPRRPWLGCLGWALALGVCAFPIGLMVRDFVASSRAEADFKRKMAKEEQEMKVLLQQMEQEREDTRRIAQEIKAIRKAGGK